ncbi:ETS homologous factor-like [Penaeus chinensis]|uniref:ETS homologous factor-like n=1 Tax=Penaeus chinensis TaxID=139456 RepID=UPI001FB5C608|nr:ETS homologous factor-like [Penaeus chinensis]
MGRKGLLPIIWQCVHAIPGSNGLTRYILRYSTVIKRGTASLTENSNALTEAASSSPHQLFEDQYEILQKIPSKKKKRVRGPKNWEFLIRLLVNPRSNPSLICWEDESNATFRLVQPYAIAKLWASRTSHTPPLSYNNFARGLRYHYRKGALEAVSEKQLVYRCGPKALRFLNALRPESS